MKSAGKFGFGYMLALSFAMCLPALGQQYPQNPPASTPPTFPEGTKQNPNANQPQNPDQYPQPSPNPQTNPDQYPTQNPDQTPTAQNPAPPPSGLTQAQSAVEDAIRQQVPSSADNVKVNITDDNRIQLSGHVKTDEEKQKIEQVAKSAAPDAPIVDNIKTGTPH